MGLLHSDRVVLHSLRKNATRRQRQMYCL